MPRGAMATLSPLVKGSSYRPGIGMIAAILIMRLTLVPPANAQESGRAESILRAMEDIGAAKTFSAMECLFLSARSEEVSGGGRA